jgi:hypothetical protein
MSDANTPDDKNKNKQDLTGIFDLPQTAAPVDDPFAIEAPPAEHVDDFESIDQLGMTDHAPAEDFPASEETAIAPLEATQLGAADQTTTELLPVEMNADAANAQSTLTSIASAPRDFLDDLKNYSEKSQGPIDEVAVHYPFHFYIEGTFGPFERDKLLLFITENSIGVSSIDLDLQLKSGRVLFPRISEFAGIKLIQELRDSGLDFRLTPSTRDADETFPPTEALHYHYEPSSQSADPSLQPIILVAANSAQLKQYEEIDTVQASQFLKAEMVEAEKSELFQEVLERMTEALKQKARLKGGQALTHFEQKIVTLRLPSQYQLSVSATVLRKI